MTTTNPQTSGSDQDLLDPRTSGYVKAYAWAAIFNAVLMLFKENFEVVHDVMATIGYHHWITHGVLDLIVFFGLGMYFSGQGQKMSGSSAISYLVWSTVIGGGIIGLFNLYHTMAG